MKSDPLFFRLFSELPGCFFHLVGRPETDARRYKLEAIEYKSTAVRLDGVFRPLDAKADPAYLWEAQFYSSDKVYANLLTKIGHFLEHDDPAQDWVAVVIYPSRSLEQKNLHPYRALLESDQFVRIYLDELPPAAPDQFELGILELINAKPDATLEKAKRMIPRLVGSRLPPQVQQLMIQFVETVVLYQFPKWTREEVEKVLQVTDIRQTRVYQEALEEGIEQGIEQGVEKGMKKGIEQGIEQGVEKVAQRMIGEGLAVAEIVRLTGLTAAQVRKLSKK